jgi:hypothetical protein
LKGKVPQDREFIEKHRPFRPKFQIEAMHITGLATVEKPIG